MFSDAAGFEADPCFESDLGFGLDSEKEEEGGRRGLMSSPRACGGHPCDRASGAYALLSSEQCVFGSE